MTRAEKRQLKKFEGNPLIELLGVQNHFYKNFWEDLCKVEDPRHSSYIEYTSDIMLAMPLMKNICDIRSMQGMTASFNTEECIANTALITGKDELSEVPHYVTVNDFLSRLNLEELSAIRSKMIKALIRKRSYTNLEITKKKAPEFAETGRNRWMIENEGFNIQKNHRYGRFILTCLTSNKKISIIE